MTRPNPRRTSQLRRREDVLHALAAADSVHTLAGDAEIRCDLVFRIRMEIAAGTYETPEKLEAALERMFE